jgi:glycosyltransferase involved in cell wall biosynthesis
MKLVIQIPCLNEEATLPETLADLPKQIEGIDEIEVLIIDDGSTDRTAEVAREQGVDHILQMGTNRGLATAFRRGVDYALAKGADIVVNTDADNQYCGADIAELVQPVLRGEADLVVGCRPIVDHPEFSPLKKVLQLLGSWTLRQLSKTDVRDAPSGFRAFSRETCQRIFIHSRFSYCMETLIQAGNSGLRVASVDVRVNPKTRESRLFKSVGEYLRKSGGTMLLMFVLYRPARFFACMAAACFVPAVLLGLRFVWLIYLGSAREVGRTHIPSLLLLLLFAMSGVLLMALGVIGELVRSQRRVTEEMLLMQRRLVQDSRN